MTLRRDGDGDDGDGGDGGDDQPDEKATDPEFMADISGKASSSLPAVPGSLETCALWKGGGRRQKLLQAHLGTYFSQPEQHRAGNVSSGLLRTC